MIGHGGSNSDDKTIRIGGAQTATFIAGISGANQGSGLAVYVNSNGQLGTAAPGSSRRFKKEIKPMDKSSEAILALKPVTFHYKEDGKDTPQFGLIAEEVAEVNPDLVLRDAEARPYTVRYDAVNAMLLNEFLKEHDKVQKLEAKLSRLDAAMRKQQSQMEKVTAQLHRQRSSLLVSDR